MSKQKIFNGDVWFWTLAIGFGIWLAVVIFGCSSSKKIITKSESKTDSVSVSVSSADKQTTTQVSIKTDSSGTTTKDKEKEYERTTVITFDTAAANIEWDNLIKGINKSQNGDENDYSQWGSKQKIKSITIHEKGKKTSKENQQVTKKSEEDAKIISNQSSAESTFVSLKKTSTAVSKDKEKSSWIKDILDKWWLWILLLCAAGFVYYKRGYIKSELFGKKPLRKV